jgi:DNA-binding NarL/FixJ family response regulator
MHPKDPTENTNPDEVEVLLIADDPVVFFAIHTVLSNPANGYMVKGVHNFEDMKTKLKKYKFGIVIFAITNDEKWFSKLVALDVENKLGDVKIIIYTRFEDANTKGILENFQNLNIRAIIKTGATTTEINETVIAVHNGEELILLEIVQTKDTSIKKGKYKNSDGSYNMPEPLKESTDKFGIR